MKRESEIRESFNCFIASLHDKAPQQIRTFKGEEIMSKRLFKRLSMTVMTAVIAFGLLTSSLFTSTVGAETKNLPDPAKKTSLTVHKYATATESQTPGSGLELSDAEAAALGTTLAGVGFTLYSVDQNLVDENSTPAGLLAATGTAPVGTEQFTDANGEIKWSELSQGYYVLVETTPLAGYKKSPDTIITLPMGIADADADGDADNTGFNYDVHVYPKNVSDSPITKDVEEGFYEIGETVTWTIDARVDYDLYKPAVVGPPAVAEAYGSFVITDPLDTRLTYDPTGSPAVLTMTGGKSGPTKLTAVTDYTEVYDAATNKVTWTLTQAGMKKVDADDAGAVRVELDTKINDTAIGTDPTIANTAILDNSDANGTDGTPDGGVEPPIIPEIGVAGIEVLKVDSVDTSIFLNNAKFKIALTEQDAKDKKFVKDKAGNDVEITTGDNPETTTVEMGWGYFAGLPVDEPGPTDFYLVETQAPDNVLDPSKPYILKQEAVYAEIKVDEKTGSVTVKNQALGNPPIDEKKPTFELPKTGGTGTVLFTVAGIILMGGAAFLFMRSRKANA